MAEQVQGSYFWFLVVRTPGPDGGFEGSYQGTITPSRGRTRLDVFNSIRAEVDRSDPRARGGATVAFDLQPNKL